MSNFLETPEGPNWLHDSINKLICGENVTAPRPFGKEVSLVTPSHYTRPSRSTWAHRSTSRRC